MDKAYLDHIVSERNIEAINRMDVPLVFSDNVSRLRVQNGFSQRDMAYMVGVSKATYERIEAATCASISMETAMKIANIFRVPLMSLLGVGNSVIAQYGRYMNCTDRTQRLLASIISADLEAQRLLEGFEKDDIISVMQFSEEVHDGININRFLHTTVNISQYRNFDWYQDADVLIEINSNAYHPMYHIGDRLIVSGKTPRNGEIGIYIKDQMFYLRRNVESPEITYLEKVQEPIHKDFSPMMINRRNKEDMRRYTKVGTVIGVL